MSLVDAFASDFDTVFSNELEFGTVREISIVEDGVEKVFTGKVVWDDETLRNRLVVTQQGIYYGMVLCFIKKSWFKVEPKPEQIIYHPVNPFKVGWRVLDITDCCEVYQLYLDKLIA